MRIRLAVAVLAALASGLEAQQNPRVVPQTETRECVLRSWYGGCIKWVTVRPGVKPETTFVHDTVRSPAVVASPAIVAESGSNAKLRRVRSQGTAASTSVAAHSGYAFLSKKNTRKDLYAVLAERGGTVEGLSLNTAPENVIGAVRTLYPEFGIENRQGLAALIRQSRVVTCPKFLTPMAWVDRNRQVQLTGWSRVLGTGVNEGEMCLEYNGKIWASLLCGNPIVPPETPRVSLAPPLVAAPPTLVSPPAQIITVEKRGFPWLKTALWTGVLGGATCIGYGLLHDPHHRQFGCIRIVQITRVQ